jgi:hypothetical protein
MAGTLKTQLQLGDSATATNNFTLTSAAADGTMKLSRGNAGATTQDILTIDAAGRVAMPSTVIAGNGPAFSAYQSVSQSLTNAVAAKILFQTKEFDTTSAFDAVTNSRFQPIVAGYYFLAGLVNLQSPSAIFYSFVFKNGVAYKRGQQSGTAAASAFSSEFGMLVFLNGTTDYVEVYAVQNSGGSLGTVALAETTYFQAFLARSA